MGTSRDGSAILLPSFDWNSLVLSEILYIQRVQGAAYVMVRHMLSS